MKPSDIIIKIMEENNVTLADLGQAAGYGEDNPAQRMWDQLKRPGRNIKMPAFIRILDVLGYKLIVVRKARAVKEDECLVDYE